MDEHNNYSVNSGQVKRTPGNNYSREAVLSRITSQAQEQSGEPLQVPAWLVLVVLALIVFAGWWGCRRLEPKGPPLCVVNTSSDMPLQIRLDGKAIGRAQRMIGEDQQASVIVRLSHGQHELEARDSAGTVLAEEKFFVAKDAHGFLWTPLPDESSVFYIQITSYGKGLPESTVELDRKLLLKPLPVFVSRWFRENPQAVSVPKGWKSTRETALRRAAIR